MFQISQLAAFSFLIYTSNEDWLIDVIEMKKKKELLPARITELQLSGLNWTFYKCSDIRGEQTGAHWSSKCTFVQCINIVKADLQQYDFCLWLLHAIFVVSAACAMQKTHTTCMI